MILYCAIINPLPSQMIMYALPCVPSKGLLQIIPDESIKYFLQFNKNSKTKVIFFTRLKLDIALVIPAANA